LLALLLLWVRAAAAGGGSMCCQLLQLVQLRLHAVRLLVLQPAAANSNRGSDDGGQANSAFHQILEQSD
jgi:hypothetical protein